MISVGIDVSKGKSTVCILKPYGEIVSKPFNITHTHKDLSELSSMLFRLMMKSKSLWKQPEFIIFQFLHIYRKRIFCFCN